MIDLPPVTYAVASPHQEYRALHNWRAKDVPIGCRDSYILTRQVTLTYNNSCPGKWSFTVTDFRGSGKVIHAVQGSYGPCSTFVSAPWPLGMKGVYALRDIGLCY